MRTIKSWNLLEETVSMWLSHVFLVHACAGVAFIGNSGEDTTDTTSPVRTTTARSTGATASSGGTTTTDSSVQNGIGTDLSCTVKNSAGVDIYSERATGCFNYRDDLSCKLLYDGGNQSGAQAGESNPRPVNCYEDRNGNINNTVKIDAISNCARFCGYCCELPRYNCTNYPANGIDCSTFTKQNCFNSTKKQLLTDNCPNICGFCSLSPSPDCKDLFPECPYWNRNSNYCNSTEYSYQDKKRDCAATCQLC